MNRKGMNVRNNGSVEANAGCIDAKGSRIYVVHVR